MRESCEGKTRKPKITASQDVVNVVNSPHEVPGTSCGRHGDPTLGPEADIEHSNLMEFNINSRLVTTTEADHRADVRVQD